MEQKRGPLEGVGVTPEFWRGKRVFITGHTGFKGAWLALWLARLQASVTGYALAAPTEPSLFEAARVATIVRSVEGDLRDLDRFRATVRDAAPDVILASWCGKKVVPDKIRNRPGWSEIPAVRNHRIVEIKSPLILQPGPAALTDGLDAIVAALWPALPDS